MIIEDFQCYIENSNKHVKYNGLDKQERCLLGKHYWKNYSIQDFDYYFNSWGFRGPDYASLLGKPVNICLGDSFTVNMGGPVEHGWVYQLAKNFTIPTLNFGMDGASNDALKIVCNRAKKIFDVKNIFVMYSFLHRRLDKGHFIQTANEFTTNIDFFNKNRLEDCIESALPFWCFNTEEKMFLQSKQIYFFECPADNKDFDTKYYVNRDGFHMNQKINKIYADNLYKQWKKQNES